MKTHLKEDLECVTTCITALDKLQKAYWKETSGDSVAEAQSKEAVRRVLEFTCNFAIKQ